MKRRDLTQSAYGAPYGFSQSQISELVRGKLSEMTPALAKMLRERIGEIPELSAAVVMEDEIATVMERVEAEIRRALRNAPIERHARIMEHIEGQVTLLADLAAGGALAEPVQSAPAQSSTAAVTPGSLRLEKTTGPGRARHTPSGKTQGKARPA